MKKKVLSTVVATAMLVGLALPTLNASAAPTTDVGTARTEYAQLTDKINELNEQVQKIDAQISPLVTKMDANQKQISSIKLDIDSTNKQIVLAKADIKKQEDVLGQRLNAVYKSGGETSYLAVIFSSRNVGDLISNIQAAKKVINIDQDLVKQLNDKKAELDQKVKSLQDKNDEIVKINNDISKQKAELDTKKSQEQVLVDQAKAEQQQFDSTYLAPAEREIVRALTNKATDASLSSTEIQTTINELRTIRDNQLKSPEVKNEVNTAIETAKVNYKTAAAKETAAAKQSTATASRGTTVPGNVQAVINEAYNQIGKDYVWGATGPDTFDCSGLTSYCYRVAAGINIGRDTYAQINSGREVSYSELQPGDLIFPHSGHVGIYIGNGQMIHAPQTGEKVQIAPVYKFWRARRIIG